MFVLFNTVRVAGRALVPSSTAMVAQAQQAQPDSQMQAVLDALKSLDAKPLHTLRVHDAPHPGQCCRRGENRPA